MKKALGLGLLYFLAPSDGFSSQYSAKSFNSYGGNSYGGSSNILGQNGKSAFSGGSFNSKRLSDPFRSYGDDYAEPDKDDNRRGRDDGRDDRGGDVVFGRPGQDGAPGTNGQMGAPGPRGPPGPYGPPGPQGEKGDSGQPGADGKDGNKGAPGRPGKPGKSRDGAPGDKGEKGDQGPNGKDGREGRNGKPGKAGAPGAKGSPGQDGRDGLPGQPGAKGATGAQGRQGPEGPVGPPGRSINRGQPGPPGPPGPPGNCGCGRGGGRGGGRGRGPKVVQPKFGDIVTGGYDGYNAGSAYGYPTDGHEGYGNRLSGSRGGYDDLGREYRPKMAPMKKGYEDNYDPNKNADIYKVDLPDSKLVAGKATAGYGNEFSSIGFGGSGVKKVGRDIQKNIGQGYGRGRGASEEKKLEIEKAQEKKAEILLQADLEKKNTGYNQKVGYAGDELFEDAVGKKRAFQKGEAYVSNGFKGYDKKSEYGGDALYEQDDLATDVKVAYEVDHALKFRNDYNDENHQGNYKGDEFSVEYTATDVQGGYAAKEADRQRKAAAYEGADANGDFYKGGKYYGDDYLKYGDESKEEEYKEKGHGNPYGEGYGNDDDLYSKFKGDKKGEYGRGSYEPYHSKYKAESAKSKDADYRGYGAAFDGKDYHGKKFDAEAYSGAEEKVKDNLAFDKGNYRSVKAKGKNKAAQYKGDYQTNKKAHDVDFNVKHFEDLQTDLKNDKKSDAYYAAYDGKDFKGAFDADKKSGKYQDQEFLKFQDNKKHAKKYRGESFANGVSKDTEAELYYGAKLENVQKKEIEKEDNRRGGRRRRSRDGRDDGRGKFRPQEGNYGYYNNKRRLAQIDELRNELNSLEVNKIATRNEIIIGFISLIIAGLIGAGLTSCILKKMGYKYEKMEDDNDLEFPLPK